MKFILANSTKDEHGLHPPGCVQPANSRCRHGISLTQAGCGTLFTRFRKQNWCRQAPDYVSRHISGACCIYTSTAGTFDPLLLRCRDECPADRDI